MKSEPVIVLITTPNVDVGRKIAAHLVENRLAACVNLLPPMRSIYTWEGKVNDEEEVLLVVKTWAELFDQHLVPAVQALHPYQVPEILALPVMRGLESYLGWMQEVTRRD